MTVETAVVVREYVGRGKLFLLLVSIADRFLVATTGTGGTVLALYQHAELTRIATVLYPCSG